MYAIIHMEAHVNYIFPTITHLDDVRDIIKDLPEFVIAEREWGWAVNYLVSGADTFPEVKTAGGSASGFTTLAALVLFLGGVQLIFLGVIGEYLGRIYDEVKSRPLYIVTEAPPKPKEEA